MMAFDNQPSLDPAFCYTVWLSNGSRTDIVQGPASSIDIDDAFKRWVRMSPPASYDEAASTFRLGGSASGLSDAGTSLENSFEYYEFFTLFADFEPECMGEESRTSSTAEIATLPAPESPRMFVHVETKLSGPEAINGGLQPDVQLCLSPCCTSSDRPTSPSPPTGSTDPLKDAPHVDPSCSSSSLTQKRGNKRVREENPGPAASAKPKKVCSSCWLIATPS